MTLIVTWLWQGLAIAWLTAAAVWTMPRINAATRHVIWWLALAAVLALPVAHGLASIMTNTPWVLAITPPDVDAASSLLLPATPKALVACAAAAWAMTAAARIVQIAQSGRALGRLKRTASPFDRAREARLSLWVAACAGGHRAAELRISNCGTGACALGFVRPVILISRSVADVLSDESLDEIVMHEQAHLDRYDDWSQLLLAVIGSVAGLHPAVRFLTRRLEVDREAACDDRVVFFTGATHRYASSLLTVAAASNPEAGGIEFLAGAPTATTTASALRVRVAHLLDSRRDRSARIASATSLVSLTALALAIVASTQVAPAVIFLETAAPNASVAVSSVNDMRLAPGAASQTNVNATVGALEPPRRTLTGAKRATPTDATEPSAHSLVATKQDPPLAPPLERRTVVAPDTVAPALAALPSSPLAAVAPARTAAAKPWDSVSASATSAAGDLARAAAASGVRARSAGVSIGRFVTRARKAGANVF